MAEKGKDASDWRAEIQAIGKSNFEIREMVRLGFIDLEKNKATLVKHEVLLVELAVAHGKLREVDNEIAALEDIDGRLKLIRHRRIERVKKEREFRKAEQAVLAIRRKEEGTERRRIAPIFLGKGVSKGLLFEGSDAKQLGKAGLPILETFLDVAQAIEIPPEHLQWLVYHRDSSTSDHYSRFEIPKRSGGVRLIASPKPALRHAQAWVNTAVLSMLTPSEAATAFRPGLSIVDNARRHSGAELVVKLDLKDFFPSVTFARARWFFTRLGYNSGVSTVFALLTTDSPRVKLTTGPTVRFVAVGDRSLPQGAITSPALANVIAAGLDTRCQALAKKAKWTYSRYADDLVFSTSAKDAAPHLLIKTVDAIVRDLGFELNSQKTRIMRSPRRQVVNGLLLGPEIRVTRKDMRRWRAFIHRCETKGHDTVSREIGKDSLLVAQGFHSYLHMVNPAMAEKLVIDHRWIRTGSLPRPERADGAIDV